MSTVTDVSASKWTRIRRYLFGTTQGRLIFGTVLVVGLAGLGLGAWLVSPFFYNTTVNEALPPTIMMNTTPNQMQPATSLSILSTGDFTGSDGGHQSSGTASIYQQPDGSQFLRFDNFMVTNGPRLVVWLSDLTQLNGATGNNVGSSPNNYIQLDGLKGNLGSQNYDIPSSVDLSRYSSVIIWCEPFKVAFAIAPLRQCSPNNPCP